MDKVLLSAAPLALEKGAVIFIAVMGIHGYHCDNLDVNWKLHVCDVLWCLWIPCIAVMEHKCQESKNQNSIFEKVPKVWHPQLTHRQQVWVAYLIWSFRWHNVEVEEIKRLFIVERQFEIFSHNFKNLRRPERFWAHVSKILSERTGKSHCQWPVQLLCIHFRHNQSEFDWILHALQSIAS